MPCVDTGYRAFCPGAAKLSETSRPGHNGRKLAAKPVYELFWIEPYRENSHGVLFWILISSVQLLGS